MAAISVCIALHIVHAQIVLAKIGNGHPLNMSGKMLTRLERLETATRRKMWWHIHKNMMIVPPPPPKDK